MERLTLTKHHGLGNDFLVLVDLDDLHGVDGELARRLCHRHKGVGADGLIRVGPGRHGADVAMELYNADGGRAEMSGNGIRCLAQAVVEAGIVRGPELAVSTDAGTRRLQVRPGEGPSVVVVSAEMGPAKVGPEGDGPSGWPTRPVDMGNPHLVLLVPDPSQVDVVGVGGRIEAEHAGGLNVEFVSVGPGRGQLTMRVWERGVGETAACGTGACAAAAAGHEWGLVGTSVVVHQPGGPAEIRIEPDTLVLSGPVERIARVEVEM